jgi:hypothetical protein
MYLRLCFLNFFIFSNAFVIKLNKFPYRNLKPLFDGESNLSNRKMSWPLDFLDAPQVLDGTLAGDAGFDPLGLASNKKRLFLFREAEIKHARIAMLAAVGWPTSELYHYQLSQYAGLDDLLAAGGKAPSVLNGGLDNYFILFGLGLFFAVGGILEFELMRQRKEAPEALQNFFDMWREDGWDTPGNYGFGYLLF